MESKKGIDFLKYVRKEIDVGSVFFDLGKGFFWENRYNNVLFG